MRRLLPALFLLGCTAAAQTPRVGLSINGRAALTMYRGWPAVLAATFYSEDGTAVTLGARQGAWTGSLRLVITGNGIAVPWPVRLLEPDVPRVVLDAGASAQAVWLLSPEDSARLSLGSYRLQAALDTTVGGDAGDWKGSANSAGVEVEVKDPPEPLTDDGKVEQAMAQSFYQELSGDAEGALNAVQNLLDGQPYCLPGLARKGDLLLAAGRYQEAIPVYQAAIEQFKIASPAAQHPPAELLRAKAEAQWRASGVEP